MGRQKGESWATSVQIPDHDEPFGRNGMEQTRSSLLRRVRDLDDATGWNEFDQLYRPMLVSYARQRGLRPEEADEIAQECMSALVPRIKTITEKDSFRGWLRGMVANKVSDYLKQRGKHRRAGTDLLSQTPAADQSPEELWQRQWNETHLRYCIERLRVEYAPHTLQAFAMYVLQDRPVQEIKRQLGMTANQIYVAKARVLARIRERFGEMIESLYGESS